MCRPAVRQWGQLLYRAAVNICCTCSQPKATLLFTNASELTAGPGEQTRSVPYFTAPQGVALSLFHLIIYAPKQTPFQNTAHTHTLIMTYKHTQKLYRSVLSWEKPKTWLKISLTDWEICCVSKNDHLWIVTLVIYSRLKTLNYAFVGLSFRCFACLTMF